MNSPAGAALRARAARVLAAVLGEGRSLKAMLGQALPNVADPRDRALLEAICFGVLRHRRRYDYALSQWLAKPLAARDFPVHCLLLAGLAQLDALGLPAHAAVGATAEATRELGRPPLVGLVNALLRRASREPLPASRDPAIASSHPDWLVAALRADWPADAEAVLAANNRPAPMWLRVNPGQLGIDRLMRSLREDGLSAATLPLLPNAARVDDPIPVERLPFWHTGALSVQDGAAQLAVLALAPSPDERVLDACAAPGGKSAQIAERLFAGDGELTALDIEARRLERVTETLQRQGLDSPRVHVKVADAAVPEAWWDGRAFDAILLDAPCSATGIIRRQPDIKWHRRADDIPALVAQQARLLEALWPLLRPGGRLLYATCSVLVAENAGQVDHFLAAHPDAAARPLDDRFGRASGAGRQRLPGEDGMDGFFYALLQKAG
ncbi:MAG TPA: 16S rRNA (cytosine(967)-C(5))-methyltransferase RsmB [Arenimonas sp.]|uniref:16S rRNA (cytosine(967)-C(5))-methyltransferase RsmB n=1 Tax=Arenimonas sp. TaxID=1872635 RepID=UPI002D7E6D1D|nr:16S rRNA (cytosine(967)-C(5))-methyltransferase RsmB [Arenimonas sp.]HEU0154106.1 16S rRNA (cytosine(967)-C(5))-methyltransferase RsmB [Arenimonas sp.]